MGTIDALAMGFSNVFSDPIIILYLVAGVFLGIIFGAIPGLTAALGVSLALPFTFGMTSNQGLTLLTAIYVGGIAGGLVSATLINIPGSPASIVTCFDGAPMARKGRPADALTLGSFASLVGGLISAAILITIAPQIAKVALAFGSWEMFAMGIMGLSVVVGLCSNDIVKGLIAATIGVLLAMVGIDPVSSAQRFTFGFWQLGAGFNLLATLMGLFAFAEILNQIKGLKLKAEPLKVEKLHVLPRKELLKGNSVTFGVGSIIGTIVGILPGVGQSTASLLSYNQVRQMSKTPEKFGTGHAEGIIASESANNACCGGALIPMMTLGIPGDTVTAILLGGLIVHGLQAGPLLFTNSQSTVGTIFVSFIIANIVMYFLLMGLMRLYIRVLAVPLNVLFGVILVMCVVGTFSVNHRLFDSWVLLGIGVVAYFLFNNNFPLPPIVLGFILGPIIETNFRVAIISSQGSLLPLLERPVAIGLLIFGLFTLVWPIMSKKRASKKQNVSAPCA